MVTRFIVEFILDTGRKGFNTQGRIFLAYAASQILFEESRALMFICRCLGSWKETSRLSPGRAVNIFTCFIQLLLFEVALSVCFLMNLVVSSFILFLTSFFKSLYLALLPCLEYSLFFLLAACLTAVELNLPSKFDILIVFAGQWRSSLEASWSKRKGEIEDHSDHSDHSAPFRPFRMWI